MLLPNIFFQSSNMDVSYALRPTQIPNILPSLMLRSKICASLFQDSTIIDATLQDLRIIIPRFYHHWCYVLRSCLQFPNIMDGN